ncbi:MAG: hypothetical protein H9847_06715 [Candidatus Anaerobiospirillum pullicola]|uniref:Uncharacterized protein n=1 Tax=Candidatus Anaerobiospirillum pullicola TaxID=2838451 RepID=A0A948WZG9_9GAMM|nr:hypothetical protein [Candidatus Anaerobiospirillum pullicola]
MYKVVTGFICTLTFLCAASFTIADSHILMLQQQEQEEEAAAHATITSNSVTDSSNESDGIEASDDSTGTVSNEEQTSTNTDSETEQIISA